MNTRGTTQITDRTVTLGSNKPLPLTRGTERPGLRSDIRLGSDMHFGTKLSAHTIRRLSGSFSYRAVFVTVFILGYLFDADILPRQSIFVNVFCLKIATNFYIIDFLICKKR
jgi:hypothetical protein